MTKSQFQVVELARLFADFPFLCLKLNDFPMVTRIVRMEFLPEKLAEFQAIFDESKHQIRQFPGCLHLELHGDARHPEVRYTLSRWESEAALDAYRHSELFGSVWPRTKVLFAGKTQAFTLEKREEV